MSARIRESESLEARRREDKAYRHLLVACCHAADTAHMLAMGGEQEAARNAKAVHAALLEQVERWEAIKALLARGIPEPVADAVHRPAAEAIVAGMWASVRRTEP